MNLESVHKFGKSRCQEDVGKIPTASAKCYVGVVWLEEVVLQLYSNGQGGCVYYRIMILIQRTWKIVHTGIS